MRTDLFDFDLPPERIALRPAAARCGAAAGGAAGRPVDATAACAICRICCGPAMRWWSTIPGHPGAAAWPAHRPRRRSRRIEATLITAARRLALARIGAGRPRSLQPGDIIRFGNEGTGLLPRPARRDGRKQGRGRRGDARLSRFTGRCSIRRSPSGATCRCRPTSPQARARRARPQPTIRPCSRRRKARSRRRPRACISRRADRSGAARTRRRPAYGHAACRRRHVSAGQGRRHRRAHVCMPNGVRSRRNRGRAQCGARERRPDRRRRHDVAAAAGKRGRRRRQIAPFAGETAIFITPGYRFRAVDVLMTNFHLPRSTLFMLVSAFCGLETMQRAYAHAIAAGYRFYSYGDACLLFPDRSDA